MSVTEHGSDLAGLVREDLGHWRLSVVPIIANHWGAIYGGAALGASIDIATRETDTPVRWATTRFLAAPSIGQTLDLRYTQDAAGRRTSHGTVVALVDGERFFETMIVAGDGDQRSDAIAGQWARMPDVPGPEDCPPMILGPAADGYAMSRIERRVALGPHPWREPNSRGPGRVATWLRLVEGSSSSPAGLAWLADIVATAFAQAVGPLTRATSLDNTIRFARIGLQSEWVLTDVAAEAAADGYAYGRVDCYAVDGTLLATATQTCLCRRDSPQGTHL